MGFGVWGLGFRVYGVWGLGFMGFWGLGFRVSSAQDRLTAAKDAPCSEIRGYVVAVLTIRVSYYIWGDYIWGPSFLRPI